MDAQKDGMHFRVILLDAGPEQRAKEMLRNITAAGVNASYALLNALAYVIREVGC